MGAFMTIVDTPIADAFLVKASPITDSRGSFSRLFCERELKPIIDARTIKQINFSRTEKKGAVRGMHFQYPPMAETKLVRCVQGTVYDVVIDLRKNSNTFLHWHGTTLSRENMHMLCIPEGCAHGFQTLAENCEMLYLHTQFYSPEHEGVIHCSDPAIGINWPQPHSAVSERDNNQLFISPHFEGL